MLRMTSQIAKKQTFTLAVSAIALLMTFSSVEGQSRPESHAGPYISSGGAVFSVPSPDFATPTDHTFRIVFDVAAGSLADGEVTVGFNSIARFMNMHGQAGVPLGQLDLALVVHGSAAKDVLDNAAYNERLGYDNPNTSLLTELIDAGVRVIVCGQSAMGRGISRDGFLPGVELALSAMTAHQVLQFEGYLPNPF